MNKRQKIVQEAFLNNEEAVIKRLKQVYNQSLKDITGKAKALQDQINTLDALEGMTSDPEELARLQSMKQAKVYQKQYQDALKKQVSSILDNMQVEEFKTVSEYLNKCYEEGFLGTMYDLQGQGIPLCFPMDQEAMVRAVQLDSKISKGLYSRLGEDVALLKRKITAQVSRGISTGMTFQQVAQQLAEYTNIGFNNAVRIARTEGHRIQVQSGMDACYKAKDKGADVVKQWDSTLDGRTRPKHKKCDGEIRELDEPFSNGLMFPGDPSGGASEVVNCRCALLQRARWALDDEFSKYDNFSGELKQFQNDKAYQEFKKDYFSKENVAYMKHVEDMQKKYGTKKFEKILTEMTDEEYKKLLKLEKERPSFYGMYKGQNIVKIKEADYDEFKKKYKEAAKEIEQNEAVLKVNHDCEIAKKFGTEHYDAMHERVVNSPDQNVSKVWKQYEAEIKVGNAAYKGHEHCMGSTIYVNGAKDAKGNSFEMPYQVTFHESGHAIDSLARKTVTENNSIFARHYSSAYKNGLFPQTIKDEVNDLVKKRDKELKAAFKAHADDAEWFHEQGYIDDWYYKKYKEGVFTADRIIPKYKKAYAYSSVQKEVKASGSKIAYGDLSDMLEGATGGKIQCGIGHGKKYWTDRTYDGLADGLATEAFAEMIDSTFSNHESLAMIQKYLPKSYAVFQELIEALLK